MYSSEQRMVIAFRPAPPLPQQPRRSRRALVPHCATRSPSSTPRHTPNHRRIPFLSFLIDVLRKKIDFIALARRYGRVYKTGLNGVPFIVIADLEAINMCYRDVATFRSAGAYPPSVTAILGQNSVVALDGTAHTSSRAKYQIAFSPQIVPLYFPEIRKAACVAWDEVHRTLLTRRRMRLEPVIKDLYLRLIVSLTTGSPDEDDASIPMEQFEVLRKQFKIIADGVAHPPFSPWFQAAFRARAAALEPLSALIKERMASQTTIIDILRSDGAERLIANARAELRTGKLDLLTGICASSALETGDGVTHDPAVLKELAESVLTLWNAGYSTQGAATLSCLLSGWLDERVLQRLQEEQDAIVRAAGTKDVLIEQISAQMPLLDSFLTETLRMYPPAVASFRKTATGAMVCGHKIPPGHKVMLDYWGSQRDEKYYPDPDTFMLGRFMPETSAPKPPAIVSFGALGGAHFCIGTVLAKISMKTVLATLLREFDLVLAERQTRSYRSIPDVCPRSGVIVLECRKRADIFQG